MTPPPGIGLRAPAEALCARLAQFDYLYLSGISGDPRARRPHEAAGAAAPLPRQRRRLSSTTTTARACGKAVRKRS